MGNRFDHDDEEYLELLSEYERYVQKSHGAYEDFDEWLEVEYGRMKKKALKRNIKKTKETGY
jgi:hypothetical protein